MAAVSNSLFSTDTPGTTGATSNNSSNKQASGTQATDPLANESTFLTLLVAQLKNQDPSSPMDGTTFVTQLAQFSNLEQNLAMRQDLDSIDTKYTGTASASASASSGTDGTSSSSGTGSPSTGNSQAQPTS